jgi:hypothetical protein
MDAILMNNTSKLTKGERNIYDAVDDVYRSRLLDPKHGSAANLTITDVYGGYTNNTLKLDSYGHYDIYWRLSGITQFQGLELFAGNFAANTTRYQSHLDGLNEFFPKTTSFLNEQVGIMADRIGGG